MLNPVSLGEKPTLPLVSNTLKALVPAEKNITLLHANSVLRPAANNIGLIIVGIFSVLALLYALLRYLLNSWARTNYPKEIFLNPSLPKELVLLRQNAKLHEKIEGVNKQHGLSLNPYSLHPSFSMNNEPQIEVMDMKGGSWRFPLTEPADHELIDLHKAYFDRFQGTTKPRTIDHDPTGQSADALRLENRRLRNSLDSANKDIRELRGRLGNSPLQRRLDELLDLNTKLQKKIDGLQTENDALTDRATQAEKEVSRLSKEKDQLLDIVDGNVHRIEELEKDNAHLTKKLSEAESALKPLEDRLKARGEEIDRLAKRERRLIGLLKEADQDLRAKDAAILEWEAELNVVEELLGNAREDINNLTNERNEHLDLIDDQERRIREQQAEIDALTNANEGNQRQIQHLLEQMRALQEQNADYELTLRSDDDKLFRRQKTIDALTTENERLREQLANASDKPAPTPDIDGNKSVPPSGLDQTDALTKQLKQLESELQHLRAREADAQKRASTAEEDGKAKQTQITALEEQLSKLRESLTEAQRHASDASSKQSLLDEQQKQISELREQVAYANQKAESLQTELEKEQAARKQAEQLAQTLQGRITELEAQNSSITAELRNLRDAEAQAQVTAQELAKANQELNKRATDAESLAKAREEEAQAKQQLLDEKEKQLALLREEVNAANKKANELDVLLTNEKAARAQAEERNKALESENKSLMEQVVQLTDSEAEARRKAKALENENRDLSQRVSQAESLVKSKQQLLEDKDRELEDVKERAKKLNEALQTQSAQLASQNALLSQQLNEALEKLKQKDGAGAGGTSPKAGGSGSGDDTEDLKTQIAYLSSQMTIMRDEYESDRKKWVETESTLQEEIKRLRSQLDQAPASRPTSPDQSPKHATQSQATGIDAETQYDVGDLGYKLLTHGEYTGWINERLRFTETEAALRKANEELQQLRNENQKLKSFSETLEKSFEEARETFAARQEKITLLEEEAETARKTIEQLNTDAERLLHAKTAAEKESSQLKQKMDRAEQALAQAPSAQGKKALTSRISSSEGEDEGESPLTPQPKKGSPGHDARSLGTKLSEELTAAAEEREKLESAFEVERVNWRREFASLSEKIAELEDRNKTLAQAKQGYLQELQKDRAVQDDFNADAEDRISDLTGKNRVLRASAGDSAALPRHQRGKTLGAKDKPTAADALHLGFENERLQLELEAARKIYSQKEEEIGALVTENEQLKEALRDALTKAGYQVPESGAGSSLSSALSPSPALPEDPADKDSG